MTTDKKWEDRFDEAWSSFWTTEGSVAIYPHKVKDFISQLLEEQRRGFVEDLKKHKNAADWYDDLEIAIDDLITKYSAPPNPNETKGEI